MLPDGGIRERTLTPLLYMTSISSSPLASGYNSFIQHILTWGCLMSDSGLSEMNQRMNKIDGVPAFIGVNMKGTMEGVAMRTSKGKS